jgi:hypothetical protein
MLCRSERIRSQRQPDLKPYALRMLSCNDWSNTSYIALSTHAQKLAHNGHNPI